MGVGFVFCEKYENVHTYRFLCAELYKRKTPMLSGML